MNQYQVVANHCLHIYLIKVLSSSAATFTAIRLHNVLRIVRSVDDDVSCMTTSVKMRQYHPTKNANGAHSIHRSTWLAQALKTVFCLLLLLTS